MQSGIEQGELQDENPEFLTLIFLGMINNFINKTSEMKLETTTLAKKITNYFLLGVKKQ